MTYLYERLLREAAMERQMGWAPAAPNAAPHPAKLRATRPETALMWMCR